MNSFRKAKLFHLKSLNINHEAHKAYSSYYGLGEIYEKEGNSSKAVNFYLKSLKISQKVNGENHLDNIQCYQKLLIFEQSKGNFQKVEELHMKSLKIAICLYGETKESVLYYTQLGLFYVERGNLAKLKNLTKKLCKFHIIYYHPNSLLFVKGIWIV